MTLRVQHVSVPMPAGGNDKARHFYVETLGLREITPPAVLGTERFVWLAVGDDGHEVHVYTMDPFVQSQRSPHFCLHVDSIAEYKEKLQANGFAVNSEPDIVNRPRFSTVDPFGNKVEITEITGQYA